jgi:hypothetical protein
MTRLRVDYLDILAFSNESRNIVEIHVLAAGGIVQPAIPIFLDEDGSRLHFDPTYAALHTRQIYIDTTTVKSYSLVDAALQQNFGGVKCQQP